MRPVGGPASAEKGGRKAVGFAGQSWCFPGQHVTPPGVPAEVPFPAGWTPPPSTPKCRILGPDRARETVQPDPKKGITGEAGQGPKTGRAGGPKLYPAHPPRRQSCRANPQFDDHLNAPSGWHGSRGDLGAENGAPHPSCPLSPSLPTPLVPGAGLGPTVQSEPCPRLGFRSSISQLLTVRTGPKAGLRSPLFQTFWRPPRRNGPSPRLADTLQYSCCPLVVDVQRA